MEISTLNGPVTDKSSVLEASACLLKCGVPLIIDRCMLDADLILADEAGSINSQFSKVHRLFDVPLPLSRP